MPIILWLLGVPLSLILVLIVELLKPMSIAHVTLVQMP